MKRFLSSLTGLLVAFICNGQSFQKTSLPRAEVTPQVEEAITRYHDAMQINDLDPHSIMILKGGQVIGERWFNGWQPEQAHTLYSVSKTFTVMALGFAVQDGLVSVEDRVMDFFPEKMEKINEELAPAGSGIRVFPDLLNPLLPDLKVKHLLMMGTGHATDLTSKMKSLGENGDWIETFLKCPITRNPGSRFCYNSIATFMVSAILQKVTGQKVNDYLYQHLLQPLGISPLTWDENPQGINFGGWGLSARTEDLAKLGQFLLQKGQWNGQQLLPASWIEECSAYHIDNNTDDISEWEQKINQISEDWIQGYCYQMWRGLHNSFRADGAYGQYVVVIPDHDAVVVMTAHSKHIRLQMHLMWENILPVL